MIRPVITYGAEIWNRPNGRPNPHLREAEQVQYQALRRITGGYHGSDHDKLLAIAGIEPLQTKLNDISNAWAARAIRTGDRTIRTFLEDTPTRDAWFQNNPMKCPNKGDNLDSPILACFSLTYADQEDILSYGDRDDMDTSFIDQLNLVSAENPYSKTKLP